MAVTKLPPPPESDDEQHYPQPQQQQSAPTPGLAPSHSLHHHTVSNASTASVDIEAWTLSALDSLNIAPIGRRPSSALSIPLDDEAADDHALTNGGMKLRSAINADSYGASIAAPRGAPQTSRETTNLRQAMRKGKEGSRHKRRWENDHLLGVPNAQPPLPSDWEVHPTYPVLPTVPYQLAQYWDKGLRERAEERKAAFAAHRKKLTLVATTTTAPGAAGTPVVAVTARADVGKVPKDLRAKAKRTPAVKSWLRVLEEPVRAFLVERGLVAKQEEPEPALEKQQQQVVVEDRNSSDEMDTEDEEIVFVGRNGTMREGRGWNKTGAPAPAPVPVPEKPKPAEREKLAGMLLDTSGDDDSGLSGERWLTHSISDYYGLDSKSVTVGNPARRVVYVGVKHLSQLQHTPLIRSALPPPLWEMF
ncbi:R3H-associated N-terminal domain-containing protein [Bombardia bombarda]|uniref:R3H-associated N-terminal domain-containing protein n=1 Tax=Bombardia bombarda TaxID=252184 RepID=A0AA40CGI6_9PEZI|nr:R3H-associated N-terminal domain-containing protein [Bombardia bombarda]